MTTQEDKGFLKTKAWFEKQVKSFPLDFNYRDFLLRSYCKKYEEDNVFYDIMDYTDYIHYQFDGYVTKRLDENIGLLVQFASRISEGEHKRNEASTQHIFISLSKVSKVTVTDKDGEAIILPKFDMLAATQFISTKEEIEAEKNFIPEGFDIFSPEGYETKINPRSQLYTCFTDSSFRFGEFYLDFLKKSSNSENDIISCELDDKTYFYEEGTHRVVLSFDEKVEEESMSDYYKVALDAGMKRVPILDILKTHVLDRMEDKFEIGTVKPNSQYRIHLTSPTTHAEVLVELIEPTPENDHVVSLSITKGRNKRGVELERDFYMREAERLFETRSLKSNEEYSNFLSSVIGSIRFELESSLANFFKYEKLMTEEMHKSLSGVFDEFFGSQCETNVVYAPTGDYFTFKPKTGLYFGEHFSVKPFSFSKNDLFEVKWVSATEESSGRSKLNFISKLDEIKGNLGKYCIVSPLDERLKTASTDLVEVLYHGVEILIRPTSGGHQHKTPEGQEIPYRFESLSVGCKNNTIHIHLRTKEIQAIFNLAQTYLVEDKIETIVKPLVSVFNDAIKEGVLLVDKIFPVIMEISDNVKEGTDVLDTLPF